MWTVLLSSIAINATPEPLTGGPVEMVVEGFQFTEGPVWIPNEGLVFSDIPADTIYRADKSVYRKPSGKSNGLAIDRQGRLIACEHWNRRVTRTEQDGSITTLAERYQGKRLNSPNDVVVRSDGTVYFTDPPYGLDGRPAELPFAGVFAITPSGELKLLADDFRKPNGLAFSPDEKTLYIGDSEAGHVRCFEVLPNGTIKSGRTLCTLPTPDGMKVDVYGNIWCTAEDGVRAYRANGDLAETVKFPQVPANCAFGDDGKTLYVTARTAVYKVRCTVAGAKPSTEKR